MCGCGCSGNSRRVPPFQKHKDKCSCGDPKSGSCKNPCSDSCNKSINVSADNVTWNDGPVPELGIQNGDKLTDIVRKIARGISTLKNI